MASLPSPPFVLIDGVHNYRDIGGHGLPPSSTSSVRRSLVFRSADPNRASTAGVATLRALGLTVIYDLRSAPELAKAAPVAIDGVARVWAPVFEEHDYAPERIAVRFRQYASSGPDGFVHAYADILASAGPSYRTVLLHLAQPCPTPCLIHCTAGKDRTGVLVALLLSLVGVPDDAVADEYALTDVGLAEVKPAFIERLLENPALEGDEEGVRNMVGAKSGNMLATLEMLRERYGGAEGYVREVCGLSEEEVERLKGNLVVDAVPVL
ncbi:protein-tyrosine phosphatase-like protein [Cryomyces antarcticus]